MKNCHLCKRKACGHNHEKDSAYFVTAEGCIYCHACEDWVKSAE